MALANTDFLRIASTVIYQKIYLFLLKVVKLSRAMMCKFAPKKVLSCLNFASHKSKMNYRIDQGIFKSVYFLETNISDTGRIAPIFDNDS